MNSCWVDMRNDTELPIQYKPTITKVLIKFHIDVFPNLPPHITHLALSDCNFPQKYIQIPKSVTNLYFMNEYCYPITIPSHITKFRTPRNYNYPIILPPNIKHLEIVCNTIQPIIITGASYPKTLYIINTHMLPKHIFESPMMYYLLDISRTSMPGKYSVYFYDVSLRININIYNNKRRRQGLFDTL